MEDMHLGSPALPLPPRLGALRGTSTGASTPGLAEGALNSVGNGGPSTRLELLARVAANRVMLDRMEQAVLRVGVRLPPVEVRWRSYGPKTEESGVGISRRLHGLAPSDQARALLLSPATVERLQRRLLTAQRVGKPLTWASLHR